MRGKRAFGLDSRQIAAFVILILMSVVLSFIEFPLFSEITWLQYDPSGAIAALTCMLFGPWAGIAVAFLSWIPHLISGPIGAFLNIMSSASLVFVLGSLFRRKPNSVGVIVGILGAVISATVVSICLNFVVTPFFLGSSYTDVAALVVPYLLPFNAAKALLNSSLGVLTYFGFRKLLKSSDVLGA